MITHPVLTLATVVSTFGFGQITAQAAGGGDPTSLGSLFQTGGFSALAAVLLLFARTAYKRESDRSDRLEEEGRKTNELVRDRVMPSLERASSALEQAAIVLVAVQERMRDEDIRDRDEYRRRHREPDDGPT